MRIKAGVWAWSMIALYAMLLVSSVMRITSVCSIALEQATTIDDSLALYQAGCDKPRQSVPSVYLMPDSVSKP